MMTPEFRHDNFVVKLVLTLGVLCTALFFCLASATLGPIAVPTYRPSPTAAPTLTLTPTAAPTAIPTAAPTLHTAPSSGNETTSGEWLILFVAILSIAGIALLISHRQRTAAKEAQYQFMLARRLENERIANQRQLERERFWRNEYRENLRQREAAAQRAAEHTKHAAQASSRNGRVDRKPAPDPTNSRTARPKPQHPEHIWRQSLNGQRNGKRIKKVVTPQDPFEEAGK
jgi:hypothetical protein